MQKNAHKTDDGRTQTIKDHLIGTAELAKENAVEIFKPLAYSIGLAHDIGKYAESFQEHLNGINNKYEHSVCGALEYEEILKADVEKLFSPLIKFCIACHHTGLQDGSAGASAVPDGTLGPRIKPERKNKDYTGKNSYASYKDEIVLERPDFAHLFKYIVGENSSSDRIELYAFFTRYLFSCLVDADYIDTERFFYPQVQRGQSKIDFDEVINRLDRRFSSFIPETELQKARSRIQNQAYANAEKNKSNISILNMPTGSGKTLCSLKIALEKLKKDNSKNRLIYVIPYTGIIDQTVNEFRPFFDNITEILQHHSNYSYDDKTQFDEEYQTTAEKMKRTCENWDAPVIITTAVQFFESVCHYKSSSLRKLHNIANSVIVFDEIHTLPIRCLQQCIRSIGFITKYLNSEAIFLSATMPNYAELLNKFANGCTFSELITDTSEFKYFKKADYVNMKKVDMETVAMKAENYSSSLIIMNSRKSAREMYNLVNGNKYHLSKYMTSVDIKKTIENIKADLKMGKKVTVVSTSLIEAGIDLDFETVFRELNALPSILQAGGRCNREGKREKGTVYIFETENTGHNTDVCFNTTRNIIDKYSDIDSVERIEHYYNSVIFFNHDIIDKNTISKDINDPKLIPFRSFYDKEVKLIDDNSIGVIMPQNDECEEWLERLYKGDKTVLRNLQKYTIPLNCIGAKSEFDIALSMGIIKDSRNGVYVFANKDYYDEHTGLNLDKDVTYIY